MAPASKEQRGLAFHRCPKPSGRSGACDCAVAERPAFNQYGRWAETSISPQVIQSHGALKLKVQNPN
jgi:hypothetical protein